MDIIGKIITILDFSMVHISIHSIVYDGCADRFNYEGFS